MKKFLAILLALTLLAVLLTSCTKDVPQPDEVPIDEPHGDTLPPEQDSIPDSSGEIEIAPAPPAEVLLYLPNDDADGFELETVTIEISAQNIFDALIAHGAIPEGISVLSFQIDNHGVETQEGDTVSYTPGDTTSLFLDLSAEMQSTLLEAGSAGELMLIGSLVNTLLTVYEADEITLTCEGAALESGHNVYDEPISFMDLTQEQ